jgi:hypothetical protein
MPKNVGETAIHEAGHAAAAWRLGHSVRWASIVATEDYLGAIQTFEKRISRRIEYDDSPKVVASIETHIQICHAGPLAQRKRFPRSRWRMSGSKDFEIVAKLFSHIAGFDNKSQYLYSSLLRRRAELLVDYLEPEIEQLAAALLAARTLKWPEIRRICLDAR